MKRLSGEMQENKADDGEKNKVPFHGSEDQNERESEKERGRLI